MFDLNSELLLNALSRMHLIIEKLQMILDHLEQNKIKNLSERISNLEQRLDSKNDLKKNCPRCKGARSITFYDKAGDVRNEPCRYCLGEGSI